MGAMASQITPSPMSTQPFVQAQIKENLKAPRHWPFFGNSPVTGEFPAQMASNAENVSIWWRQHDEWIVAEIVDQSNHHGEGKVLPNYLYQMVVVFMQRLHNTP